MENETVLLKLKRKYSKDETVSLLQEENKRLKMEIGMLKSERDEALYNYNQLDDQLYNLGKKDLCRFSWYKRMKQKLDTSTKLVRKEKIENSRLLQKIVALNCEKIKGEKFGSLK